MKPLLISRPFTDLMLYRISITLSYQILAVTVGWHIYELTHDVMALGLVGLAEVIPYFGSALFAGHAVDHFSKKKIAILGCGIYLFISALMLGVSQSFLIPLGIRPEWFIYIGIGFAGLARALIRPTYQVLFAKALERQDYSRGTAISASIFQLSMIAGPALGGALIAWMSLSAAYLATGIFAIVGILSLLNLNYQEEHQPAQEGSIFSSIGEGLSFVFGQQIMLAAMALDMFAVLFGGASSMLPAFIQQILQGSPENLGLLRAAPALGSTLVGLCLARKPLDQHAGQFLLASVAAFGLSIIGFGFSTQFWTAAFFLALTGVFDGVSVVLRTTILQLTTPDQMRGRVSAINGLFIGSSNEVGALESGVAASLLGLAPSIVFGGFMTLLVVAICSFGAPQLRKLHLQSLYAKV